MSVSTIYSNDFFHIILEDDSVFIKVLKKDYSIQAFNDLLKDFPRISIVYFVALKTALANEMLTKVKIGELKPKVELTISSDQLVAYAQINLTEKEFGEHDKKQLLSEIIDLAVTKEISYGVDIKGILNRMRPIEKFEIAKGKAPIPGADAVITMFQIKKVEPLLVEDGNVNHYELNLINKIEKGDWLGERLDATEGISGMDICGTEIPAENGRQQKLQYEASSVDEVYDAEKGNTTLYAKLTGAIVFDQETIGVRNFIEVPGDVSYQTGNVDFDGYVDVKKTVDDNFSVRALYDIQVLGDMGIGGVDTIESKEGNIYIRGGIAGKNKAKIICQGDLFTKFASDCTIECGGTVNIGYYAMNCQITAKEVLFASPTSKIIGGLTKAVVRIEVGDLGSKAGIQTRSTILGFDRDHLRDEYESMGKSIIKLKEKMETLKKSLSRFSGGAIKVEEREKYEVLQRESHEAKKTLDLLMKEQKKYTSYLSTKGEGEIKVKKCTYTGAIIKMKDEMLVVHETTSIPMSYYIEDGEIKTQ